VAFEYCAAEAQELLGLFKKGVIFGGECLGGGGLQGGVDL
jgi:hypothetical protein